MTTPPSPATTTTQTSLPPQVTLPPERQARGLSVEARWDGELLGGWTLDAGESLTAGPEARCDLVVSRSVLTQRRAVITLDASGETYAVDLPEGTLLAEPCRSQGDVYRAPAWRRVATTAAPTATPRTTHYPIDHPLDFRLGPWRLQIRPGEVAPKIARRRRGTKRPIAALIASALVHLLLIAAALGTPKPKIPLPDPSAFPRPTTTYRDCSVCIRGPYDSPRRCPRAPAGIENLRDVLVILPVDPPPSSRSCEPRIHPTAGGLDHKHKR